MAWQKFGILSAKKYAPVVIFGFKFSAGLNLQKKQYTRLKTRLRLPFTVVNVLPISIKLEL